MVKKDNGRRYLAYQRYRGTPKAWLRVQLPADPLSVEFVIRAKLDATTTGRNGAGTSSTMPAAGQEHEMLHLREDGEPWTYEGFKTAGQREMNREVFKRFRAEQIVFHGTRKNAVNNLLEVGCSEALVAATVKRAGRWCTMIPSV
jgi:hypothetical protein